MRIFIFFSFTFLLISASIADAQNINTLQVEGVKTPVITLNGTWEFIPKANKNFLKNKVNTAEWKNIQVPGEPLMQGFAIKYDEPMLYKRVVTIPADFKRKRVFLRFDGVYSYARLWVNGKYLKDHHGGFTRWESDITNVVSPGKECTITLEVTDKTDDISFASG